jgi:phosphate transport system permease protein
MYEKMIGMARPSLVQQWSATRFLSFFFALFTLAVLSAMVGLLVYQSMPVWWHEGFGYLTGTHWFYRKDQFGALAMIFGTVVVSFLALLFAAPFGIGAAIFTAEYLPTRARLGVKIVIELLAGVPSVVYGLLAVLFLRNWVYCLLEPFEPLSGDTLLTAGIVLGVMVLPTVMSLSDDALRGVPAAQRHAARGLGMTHAETVLAVSLPQAFPSIVAALLLGVGRALGETIAVFLVVGRQDNQWPEALFSLRPLIEGGQTLTSKLGGSETHIAYGDPLHWAAMMGLGLVLLALAAAVTLVGAWLVEKGKDGPMRAAAPGR